MKLLKITYFMTILALGAQVYTSFGMEKPNHLDITIEFADKKEGKYSKDVLLMSPTFRDYYTDELENGSLSFDGRGASILSSDFNKTIYPLLEAMYNDNNAQKEKVFKNLESLCHNKKFPRFNRIKNALSFLGIESNNWSVEDNKINEGTQLQETKTAPEEEEEENSQKFPTFYLDRKNSTPIGRLEVTPKTLPYFKALNNWVQTMPGYNKFKISENFVSLQSLKLINTMIPLLDLEDVTLFEEIINPLDNATLVDLLKAADYLNCSLISTICTENLAQQIAHLSLNNQEQNALNVANTLDENLKYSVKQELDKQSFQFKHLRPITISAFQISGQTPNSSSFALSPDKKTIATYFNQHIILWDIETRSHKKAIRVRIPQPQTEPIKIVFSSDNTIIVYNNATFTQCNTTTASAREIQGKKGDLVEISPLGTIFVGAQEGNLFFYNFGIPGKSTVNRLNNAHNNTITILAFANNGTKFATASLDKTVKVWDLYTRQCVSTFAQDYRNLGQINKNSISFSNNCNLLAICHDNFITVHRIGNKKVVSTIKTDEQYPYEATFSPNDSLLATLFLSKPTSIVLWDMVKQKCKYNLDHKGRIQKICFSPDGMLLASVSGTSISSNPVTLKIWSTLTGTCLFETTTQAPITEINFSPDGESLVYCANALYSVNIEYDYDPSGHSTRSLADYINRLSQCKNFINQ